MRTMLVRVRSDEGLDYKGEHYSNMSVLRMSEAEAKELYLNDMVYPVNEFSEKESQKEYR